MTATTASPKRASLIDAKSSHGLGVPKTASILGKGLAPVLHSVDTSPEVSDAVRQVVNNWLDEVVLLPAEKCRKWVFNPRHAIDEDGIPRLAKLIRDQGQIDPIIVAKAADGMYDILCGQRRWLSIQELNSGAEEKLLIKAKVVPESMSFDEMMAIAVATQENTDPLKDIDLALTIAELEREGRKPEVVLGKAPSTVSRLRRMATLPGRVIQEIKVNAGKITMNHGYEIVSVFEAKGELIALDFTFRIVKENLTVEQSRMRAQEILGGKGKQTRRTWVTWDLTSSAGKAGVVKAREASGDLSMSLKGVTPEGLTRFHEFVKEFTANPKMVGAQAKQEPED